MRQAVGGPAPIHIGTSGWHYGHWRGPFYPEELGTEGFLAFYAERFHTVEINNSFYQLPSESTLGKWRDAVPQGFVFAVKGSRFITHMKKLKDPARSLAPFLARVAGLGEKLGPILFQLPPRWRFNPARLAGFLAALPGAYRYTLELRDQSWINDEALDLLARHRAAFCIYDLAGYLSPLEVTPILSISASTAPAAPTRVSMTMTPWRAGPGPWPPGAGKAGRSSATSTTMKRATPPRTPGGCRICSGKGDLLPAALETRAGAPIPAGPPPPINLPL
jgi:hypothetical protein